MPAHELDLAILLRSLDDETFIAEALLYPEVSRLGTNPKSLERSVVNNALQILEKESLARVWSRLTPSEIEKFELNLRLEPPQKNSDWREAIDLRLDVVRWSLSESMHIAFIPALGIEVIGRKLSDLKPSSSRDSLLERHARAELQRKGVLVDFVNLLQLERTRELTLSRVPATVEQTSQAMTQRGEVLIGDSKSDLRSQLQNFQFREQMRRVVRMLDRADQRRERQSPGARRTSASSSTVAKRQLARIQLPTLDDTILGQDLHGLLFELKGSSAPFGDEFEDYLQDLVRETSLLELMAASLSSEVSSQTLLTISSFDDRGREAAKRLRGLYHALFEREFGCQPIKSDAETLLLEGPLAARIASLEAGTHLFVSSSEGNIPIVVSASDADHVPGSATLLPVIRIYSEFESALDLRSRLLAKGKIGSAELRAFVLSALSLPPEFVVN